MVWYSTFDVWPQSSLRSASLTLFLKNIKTFNIWNIVEIIEFWALSFHRSQIFHPRWEGIIPHALNIVRTYMYVIFLTSRDILQCITSQLLMSFLLTILTSFILLLQVIFLLHFHLVCALSVQGGEKETCQLLCITASLHQYVLSLALCHKSSFNPCCNVHGFFFLKTSYVSLIYKCRIVLKIFTDPFLSYTPPQRGEISNFINRQTKSAWKIYNKLINPPQSALYTPRDQYS